MDRRRGLKVGAPASCRSTHPQSKYVCKRKDRAAFAGGPSLGRKRPGEGERHGDVAGFFSHFEKPHALTALNFHSRHLQCAPDVSSMRRAKATLTPIKVSIVRLMHHQREPGWRRHRAMADGSLDMISQAGEPGTAPVASRRSSQENRETSGSTQAPGEQSAPAASPSPLLIATGLGITAFTLYLMTGFTPDVSQGTLVRTGLLQGFGIGFVFVAAGHCGIRHAAAGAAHAENRAVQPDAQYR